MSELDDRQALQDLMLRYAAGVDDRDYDMYQSCFADDLIVEGFGEVNYENKADWLAYVWSALEQYSSTQHMLGPQLAIVAGDRAHTRNDLQALHYFTEGSQQRFILWATYETTMERRDGQWLIVHHRLVPRGTELS